MGRDGRSRAAILAVLVGGRPVSCRELVVETGLSRNRVYAALDRCWRRGLVLRTRAPPSIVESREVGGKGGYRPSYTAKMDENGFIRYIVRTLIDSMMRDFPKETWEVLEVFRARFVY